MSRVDIQEQHFLENRIEKDRCHLEIVFLHCLIEENRAKHDVRE